MKKFRGFAFVALGILITISGFYLRDIPLAILVLPVTGMLAIFIGIVYLRDKNKEVKKQ
jgi:hypothetical protein